MNWLIENWSLIVAFLAVGGCIYMKIKQHLQLPTDVQIENIKKWLLGEVTKAEEALGSGTGVLKLRKVYDAAITKFTWVSLIPFETFSSWVDEALEEMKHLLATNQKVKDLVEGEAYYPFYGE